MKRCNTCHEYWPLSCFQRDRQRPDMRRNECRACRQERRAALKAGAPRRWMWETHRNITSAALAYGRNPAMVHQRIRRGWSVYRALMVPRGECKIPVKP